MKKKSLLAITLILLLTLGLAGCGSKNKNDVVTSGEEDHEHGDYEWIGEFEFEAGTYLLHFGENEDDTLDVGFIKLGSNITDLEDHAAHLMLSDKEVIKQEATFDAKPDYAYTLEMNKDHGHIHFTIEEAGTYAIVTEHLPEESNMQVFDEEDIELLPIKEHEGAH